MIYTLLSVNVEPVHSGDYIVADFGDNLSDSDCRRKRRLSQKNATVAEFGDCRRCLAVFGDSRRFLRQSHFSATVWTGL